MELLQKPMGKIVSLFVGWRVILLIVGIVAGYVLPYRSDFAYTTYSYHAAQPFSGLQQTIARWANFDGVHYLNIAQRGYVDEVRFFPLLPLLIRFFSLGNSGAVLIAGFVLAQSIGLASLYWLYKLLRLDYSERTSLITVSCVLLFPMSFFVGSVYTEGLFLLLSVLTLYAARKQWWSRAVVCCTLASATRVTGVVLIPIIFIELWLAYGKKILNHWHTIVLTTLGASGLIAYMVFLWQRFGDPLLFLKAHTVLGNSRALGLVNPLQTSFRYFKILSTLSPSVYEWWVAFLEFGVWAMTVVFLVLAWKMKIRKSYWWFATLALSIPALSGTFTGLPRYVLPLFPLFLPIALAKPNWVFVIYAIAAVPWLLLFAALFTRGYFIA